MTNLDFNFIKKLCLLRSIFTTIWFNFHYLPFKQAIKLPILLYKPKIIASKGSIIIKGEIKPFMIKLGIPQIFIYPNTGVMFENWGGRLYLKDLAMWVMHLPFRLAKKVYCT